MMMLLHPCLTRRFIPALLLVALSGCGSRSERLTPQALLEARTRWEQAAIPNYNLEWIASGAWNEHALVFVREGKVVQARLIEPDGRERRVDPDEAALDVEGLFRMLHKELESNRTGKATFDRSLGYPGRYRREDAAGVPPLALDVVRLDPSPPAGVPPLAEATSE